MTSVLKIFSNFKSSHLHSGGRHRATPPPVSRPPPTSRPYQEEEEEEEEEVAIPSDLLNRRRVSVSRSGRYRENHKKRAALRNAARTADEVNKEKMDEMRKKSTSQDHHHHHHHHRERRGGEEEELDGHAVADEIESLAKTTAHSLSLK